ncbi:MAG: OmpA family protein [Sulfuriferula sp.]|nr:OmpA family protein [Sulfuriferula sp.]
MRKLMMIIALVPMLNGCATLNTANPTVPLQRITSLQQQADKMLAGRKGVDVYQIQKSLAWLDLAQDEYYDGDRTGIITAATDEAERILQQIKVAANYADMSTPILIGSEKVRDDLWQQSAKLKQSPSVQCGYQDLAKLDVQLVWTGHEYYEAGWSHAKTHSEVADNLAYQAELKIKQCAQQSIALSTNASAGSNVSSNASSNANITQYLLETDALFAFNQAGVEYLVLGGRHKLDKLIATMKAWHSITQIEIDGHADRLGKTSYNQQLSTRRAEKIRDYLVQHGIAANLVTVKGAGTSDPVVSCDQKQSHTQLINCLQPNRRVEFVVHGVQ